MGSCRSICGHCGVELSTCNRAPDLSSDACASCYHYLRGYRDAMRNFGLSDHPTIDDIQKTALDVALKRYPTRREVCKRLRISKGTLYRWIDRYDL